MRGRPLVFLFLVVGGWSVGRIMLLSPDAAVESARQVAGEILLPPAKAETRVDVSVHKAGLGVAPPTPSLPVAAAQSAIFATVTHNILYRPESSSLARVVVAGLGPPAPPAATPAFVPGLPPLPDSTPARPTIRRWSGSAWAIARDGGGGELLSPLLGGSQAGVRVAYPIDDSGRTALFARAAAPLKGGPAELAAGAQWRPTRLPVMLYAEVRVTDGRVAPAAGAFGGGAVALTEDLRLDGYGQAGVIKRDGTSGFGDAQIRLIRPYGRIEVGAGAWAAAQRNATRLDAGPTIALPLTAQPAALRLSLDWRHRIAGNARPASGPVLSLGADF